MASALASMTDLKTWSYLDLAVFAPSLLVLVVSLFMRRRVWWLADAAYSALTGVLLLTVPDIFMKQQIVGKLDALHLLLLRAYGAVYIGHSVGWLLARRSADSKMVGSQLFARMIGSAFMLVNDFYSTYHLWSRTGIHFTDKFLVINGCLHGLLFVGSLVHLLREGEIGGYIYAPNFINTSLLLDYAALLVVVVCHFAFPSPIIKFIVKPRLTVDAAHISLLRMVAAAFFTATLASGAAPGFLRPEDKRAHIVGRITTQIVLFAVNLYGHFRLQVFGLNHVTPFMMSGFYITFLLIIFFRFNENKPKMHSKQQ